MLLVVKIFKRCIIWQRILKHFSNSDAQAPAGSSLTHESSHSRLSSQIRLPPINLRSFDSSFEQWQPFRDLVHSNNKDADVTMLSQIITTR